MDQDRSRNINPFFAESPISFEVEDQLGFKKIAQRLTTQLRGCHPSSQAPEYLPLSEAYFSTEKPWGEYILGSEPPAQRSSLIVSLEGPWGSGKSSLANLLKRNFETGYASSAAAPVIVTYNIWQSASLEIPPWHALVYRIAEALYGRLREERRTISQGIVSLIGNPLYCRSDPVKIVHGTTGGETGDGAGNGTEPSSVAALDVLNERLGEERLHWLEIAHALSESVPPRYWDPCLKLFGDAPSRLKGRGLSRAESGKNLLEIATSWVKLLGLGDLKGALTDSQRVLQTFLETRLIEGPDWGIDTTEFVADLDVLLHVLRPEAQDWRAVLIVEDVARINKDEIPHVLNTLGYLNQMRDVLVLVLLDRRVMEELVKYTPQGFPEAALPKQTANAKPAKGDGSPASKDETPSERPPDDQNSEQRESFLDHLVHLRYQIPKPSEAKLSEMAMSLLSRAPDISMIEASDIIRAVFEERHMTPRRLKRALSWIWFRQPTFAGLLASSRNDDPLRRAAFSFYADLFQQSEGRMTGDQLVERLQSEKTKRLTKKSLTLLTAQPWDLGDWVDGSEISWLDHLGEAKAESIALVEAIRFQSIILRFCKTPGPHGIRTQSEFETWETWRDAINRHEAFEILREIDWGSPFKGRTNVSVPRRRAIGEQAEARNQPRNQPQIPRSRRATPIGGASCLRIQHPDDLLRDTDPAELVRASLFDVDLLWMLAHRGHLGVELRAKAGCMTILLHPDRFTREYPRFSARLFKENPELEASPYTFSPHHQEMLHQIYQAVRRNPSQEPTV